MLQFNSSQIKDMISHAKDSYPVECCGLIAGRDHIVIKIVRIRNELGSPVEYMMDNLQLKKAMEDLDEEGLEIVGVYHSHPSSGCRPSDTDLSKAVFPEIDYLIISLLDRDNPEIKNFKIQDHMFYSELYFVAG